MFSLSTTPRHRRCWACFLPHPTLLEFLVKVLASLFCFQIEKSSSIAFADPKFIAYPGGRNSVSPGHLVLALDPIDFRLVGSSTKRLEERTDPSFTFEISRGSSREETSSPSLPSSPTAEHRNSTSLNLPVSTVMQPQHREVASGVANLGNTCYMNAVLQALAHAPELCLAIDYEPHKLTCPIAQGNETRRRNSPVPTGDEPLKKRSTRKSRRSGKKSPCADSVSDDSVELEFCILCEFEEHMAEVHSQSMAGDPVVPDAFVNGFVEQVAPPWFKLGVQEDSHEFLRILIEAMQKSSAMAYSADTTGRGFPHDNPANQNLYPFKLFRGKVESNVYCDSCHAKNSTIDPIEDIGLEVTHTSGSALSDLSSAFHRFTKVEPLAEYKCDKCGKMGRATKQSRLASIPPILTLHLKRFRYGSDGKPISPPLRRGREVSQLVGSSGSAKIEGHIKFLEIFDLKPFLTEEMSATVKNMFCRLFAVIVHAGKNSHSGHYIAYVRNISKNEWWKMDDARVIRATSQEVLNAEAYMLFYRVVDHPVAQDLRAKETASFSSGAKEVSEAITTTTTTTTTARAVPTFLPSSSCTPGSTVTNSQALCEGSVTAACDLLVPVTQESGGRKRKWKPNKYSSGEEWAKMETSLPPSFASIFRRAEAFISENAEFTADFFKSVNLELSKGSEVNPNAQDFVSQDDVRGAMDRFRPGVLAILAKVIKLNGGASKVLRREETATKGIARDGNKEKMLIMPVVEANDFFL